MKYHQIQLYLIQVPYKHLKKIYFSYINLAILLKPIIEHLLKEAEQSSFSLQLTQFDDQQFFFQHICSTPPVRLLMAIQKNLLIRASQVFSITLLLIKLT